jgi:hypothetical protein
MRAHVTQMLVRTALPQLFRSFQIQGPHRRGQQVLGEMAVARLEQELKSKHELLQINELPSWVETDGTEANIT